MTSADLCRERGWGPGTRLQCPDRGDWTMEITAVGAILALGMHIDRDTGRPLMETLVDLIHHDWREVTDDDRT